MNEEKPWWWPEIIDDEHLARLRADYPDKASMDDESLLDYFDNGKSKGGFSTTWDHVGDAYADYGKLAHAFLALVKETGKTPSDFS
jgi:hypothetical protein